MYTLIRNITGMCKALSGLFDNQGAFQLEMVKIVLTSHFHKKVRATIGLVPTSQLL